MRQTDFEPGKRGPKTDWDDLPALYAQFGEGGQGERRFNELLSKLSLTGEWGKRAALILRARHDGDTQEKIAAALEISSVALLKTERRALQALYDLREQELIALPRLEGSGGPTIWNNPRGIVEEYGGELEFDTLVRKLEKIKAEWAPEWGKRIADILSRLMSGEFRGEIAADYPFGAGNVGVLGYQALEALDALGAGEDVVPPPSRSMSRVKSRVGKILRRYGSEDVFWNLMKQFEDVFWECLETEEYDQAWQVAEGLAILRARADEISLDDIGIALGGGEGGLPVTGEYVRKLQKWALENLDRLSRGETVTFRRPRGRPRKD